MSEAESRLTLSEASVARLVAEGRTNEEVAASLSMDPGVVQGHLSRVYRKLGVSSRTELGLLLGTAAVDRRSE
jgi:DNA-binding CsgD family transcriptional regulator